MSEPTLAAIYNLILQGNEYMNNIKDTDDYKIAKEYLDNALESFDNWVQHF